MRLDHLLSKEKEIISSKSVYCLFFNVLFSTLKKEWSSTKEKSTIETLIYGLIAQMVRAHA